MIAAAVCFDLCAASGCGRSGQHADFSSESRFAEAKCLDESVGRELRRALTTGAGEARHIDRAETPREQFQDRFARVTCLVRTNVEEELAGRGVAIKNLLDLLPGSDSLKASRHLTFWHSQLRGGAREPFCYSYLARSRHFARLGYGCNARQ